MIYIDKKPEVQAILRKAEKDIKAAIGTDVHIAIDAFELRFGNKELLKTIVSRYFSLSWKEIISDCKKREILSARYAYMFVAYKILRLGVEEIGADCCRHHTTVTCAKRRVKRLYVKKEQLGFDIDNIIVKLQAKMIV